MAGLNQSTAGSLGGQDHLRQSIGDILRTPRGTRVMRRDYGSRLPDLMDSPMTPDRALDVYAETADALAKWEPRFKLRRAHLTFLQDGSATLTLVGDTLIDGKTVTLEGITL